MLLSYRLNQKPLRRDRGYESCCTLVPSRDGTCSSVLTCPSFPAERQRKMVLGTLLSCTIVATLFATTGVLCIRCAAFAPISITNSARLLVSCYGVNPNESRDVDPNNIFQSTLSGGAFADQDDAAIKIASRIKTVKDLGWTAPPKRKGGTRPRHRAFGGTTEQPIQLKPNYDETNEKCPEKWLSVDDFYNMVRDSSPAADTVFVALAGGKSCAERDICVQKLEEWRSGPQGTFDEAAFLKSVTDGRRDLAVGWGLFLSINTFFASCIVFPTNPAAKALESGLSQLQAML